MITEFMEPSNPSRRKLLKQSAQLFAGFMLLGKAGLSNSGLNKSKPGVSWFELVDYARWCPNVHNLQPHRIKVISETEAELYYDPARLLPIGDPKGIFTTIALGIFIDHLDIAANYHGWSVVITNNPAPIDMNVTEITLFAKLKLIKHTGEIILDRELIKKRRTSRIKYNGKPLHKDLLDLLGMNCAEYNQDFYFSNDEKICQFIIDLNAQTLFEDLENTPNRNELDKLFRYSRQEAESKKDGLWAKCMGFSGKLVKSIFRHHEKWDSGTRKKILNAHYKNSFDGTSTICWYSGKFETTEDFLKCGKLMSRNWLHLTRGGAYLQPFGSLITNENGNNKIIQTLQNDDPTKKIWLLFRAGYSKEPTKSFRLETNELILK